MRLSREEFEKTNYKMTYNEYCKCYCPDCERENTCIHSGAVRRLPRVDGGLGMCPNLNRKD